jgi:hypothetical protein
MAVQSCFCVFRDVTIPPKSEITKAHIYFVGYDARSGLDVDAEIHFADEDNSQPPTDKTDLDGRALTSAVDWLNIEDWLDNKTYRTPDLKSILQEVIDRTGWAENNNVQAILNVTDGAADESRLWSAEEYLGGVEKACLRVWWRPANQIQTPYISPEEEFQLGPFNCEITTYPTDADIHYTIDGSDPDQGDTLYSIPFYLLEDTTIKARAYKQYWLPSEIATRDYTVYYPYQTGYTFSPNQTFMRLGVNYIRFGDEDQFFSHTVYNAFVAFRSVTIPQGANITSAYLRFFTPAESSGLPDLYIRFNDVDDASPPTTCPEYYAKVLNDGTPGTLWQPTGTWTASTWYNSIDFTSELQAVVNRSGWSSGNTALLFVECIHYTVENTPVANNLRITRQRISATSDFQPELHVTWSGGSGTYYPGDYEDDGECFVNQVSLT